MHTIRIVLVCFAAVACTRPADAPPAATDGIYMIEPIAGYKDGGGPAARARTLARAEAVCRDAGRTMDVVRIQPTVDLWNRGEAEVVFRCLAPGAAAPAAQPPS